MASITTMVSNVRVNIQDADSDNERYLRPVIEKKIIEALYEHNDDYTVSTIPVEEVHLVELLASYKMCLVRAADQTSQVSAAQRVGDDPTEAKVEGLSVKLHDPSTAVNSWLELASKYWEQYSNGCAKILGVTEETLTMPDILQGEIVRDDRLTRTRVPASALLRPDAVEGFAKSVSGSDVTLTWSDYDYQDFRVFRVHRSTDTGFVPTDDNCIATLYDIHVTEYIDEGLAADMYYYVVTVWNSATDYDNKFWGISSELSAEVT